MILPQEPIRVVHRTARRFRLRVPSAQRTPARMTELQRRLAGTSGVTSAEANQGTGSILVHHDEGAVFDELLERAGLSEDVLMAAVPPRMRNIVRGEASRVAAGTTDWFFDLDARLSRATNGWLDLKMAIPLGLLSAAAWRVAAEGTALLEVPPYLLLWYTFDSFVKLHQPQIERPTVSPERVGSSGRLQEQPESGGE